MPRTSSRSLSGRRNFLAATVTLFSVGILYTSFDPLPAGEEFSRHPDVPTAYSAYASYEDTSVPLPPDTIADQASEPTLSLNAPESKPAVPPADPGNVLSSMETIKFCVLLLQDGARYMESITDYTAHFNKEERIDGDLKSPQTIALKVQHAPHFAVYMNWQSGERGRQVLFSEAYEDGCMVVKFGGMKRFLPAVRIDPHSSLAKAESRYPITQAGVLGMIRQIEQHRQSDLKRGHGVSCVRLPNQEFDGRPCYRFIIQYEDPKFSEVYRKSIMLIDTDRHIPLMVTNFTWATDVEGLSEQELDQATLIENYSFTNFATSASLVAQDFSRENPSYRM